jgi:hypothetical protein
MCKKQKGLSMIDGKHTRHYTIENKPVNERLLIALAERRGAKNATQRP